VTEAPKVLGPPTYVLVLRTSDNHAGAHNHSASSIICIFIISPKSASPITQTLHIIGEENKRKDYNNIIYIHTKYIDSIYYIAGVRVQHLLLHNWEAKHPPTSKFNVLPPALAPPLSRNDKTWLFHHLQQHGFKNPKYGVYFRKSYPTKEKDFSRIW
jgi:hypothetical protein